jgi:hypothetical protein
MHPAEQRSTIQFLLVRSAAIKIDIPTLVCGRTPINFINARTYKIECQQRLLNELRMPALVVEIKAFGFIIFIGAFHLPLAHCGDTFIL